MTREAQVLGRSGRLLELAGAPKHPPGALPDWWPNRLKRFEVVLLGHAAIFAAAYVTAFLARFEFAPGREWWLLCLSTLPVVVGLKVALSWSFSLFKGPFRYVSVRDMLCAAAVMGLSLALLVSFREVLEVLTLSRATGVLRPIPRGVLVTDAAFALVFLGAARIALRVRREGVFAGTGAPRPSTKAIILGAGDSGEMLLRDILAHPEHGVAVVGFLDDDRNKHGRLIHRVPILGPCSAFAEEAARTGATLALVAMPGATGTRRRRVIGFPREAGVSCKILPSWNQLVSGQAAVSQVRPVAIEDLLGRPPVRTDLRAIAGKIQGKTVLVTGACGSIGSELCRQILAFEPAKLVLLDQNETGLFWLERDLSEAHPALARKLLVALGDVTDPVRVREVISESAPSLVFHAAAYKHVPLIEANPAEALKNNVFGTMTVADAAEEHGVETFVLISTDKAVKPSSNMGASKRLAELYLLSVARRGARTRFVSVRFGNVLGSVGSVVPVFQRQIQSGGPVTITHRDMKRWFMTIPEAVQLVLQAAELGRGGEIFVLDMGEQVRILDLAHDMIRLSGLEVGEDIAIVETGMRPGEKLEEELHSEDEELAPTSHARIRVLRDPTCDPVDWAMVRIAAETPRTLGNDAQALLARVRASKEPEEVS